jgi:hypothetical protein
MENFIQPESLDSPWECDQCFERGTDDDKFSFFLSVIFLIFF